MVDVHIPTPVKGVCDEQAFSEQPEMTVPDAQNARARDEVTGRTRRARRSGLARVSSTTVNGANVPPKRMLSVVYDARKVTYTGLTPTTTEDVVKFALAQKKPCYALCVDKQGNVYAIDGLSTVVKYNATGTRQWSFALPVKDTQHLVRAIDVDDVGFVYCGTSSGGTRDDLGRLWCLIQQDDDVVEVLWEIETGAFVEQVRQYKGRLVTLQNKPSSGEAWVVIYDGAQTGGPQEATRSKASAPANALAIGPNGNIYVVAAQVQTTAFTPALLRGADPRLPNGKITEDWTLADLLDVDTRVWREHDLGESVLAELGDGEDAVTVPDTSGNGRDLLTKPGQASPTIKARSLGRRPALEFAGSLASSLQVLTTGPNQSQAEGFRDRQDTLFPAYQDPTPTGGYTNNAQFVAFFLVSTERELVNGKGMGFLKQVLNGSTAVAAEEAHFLAFNIASDNTSLAAGTATAGRVRYQIGQLAAGPATNASGTNSVAVGTWAASISNAVLITLVCNHGATLAGAATDHPSQLRVNGTVADEWDMRNGANPFFAGTFEAAEIGALNFGAAGIEQFRGLVHYMLVLDKSRTNTNSAPLTYPFTQNAGTATFPPDATGDSEIERIEGWIAHRFGVAHILPAGHAFAEAKGPPNRNGIASHSLPWLLNSNWQTLAKYSPAGELKAVVSTYAAYRAFAAQSIGGIGYGVQVDSDGNVYTMGPHALTTHGAPANDYTLVRKVLDNADSFTFIAAQTVLNGISATPSAATGAWSKTYNDLAELTGAPVNNVDIFSGYKYPKVGIDKHDAIFFPFNVNSGFFAGIALIAYDKTGGFGLAANRALTGNTGLVLGFSQGGHAAAVDPNVPVYDAPTLAGSVQNAKLRAEFLWLATAQGTPLNDTNEVVHKIRFVQASRVTGSPRVWRVVTVAGGVVRVGTTLLASPAGSGTLAQPELSATADYIAGFVAFGKVYLGDGLKWVVYDPKTDVVSEWKAMKGRIPLRSKLGTFWRGRAVVGRSADDGHIWHLSAQSDLNDWDIDPPSSSPTQATDGVSSNRIGRCPDIINCLIEVNDDVLLFGCDHSIYRLRGDPQAGGEFDLVTDTEGLAFGQKGAKDPAGNVYAFSSRGGVVRIAPDGFPQRISSRSIERRLQAIDLSTYWVEMEWDVEAEGLRVFVVPFGTGGPSVTHYFWDAKNGWSDGMGWWPDVFGQANQGIQPTCSIVLDGDAPTDRQLTIGCEDGFLRRFSRTATKDDQTAAGVDVPIISRMTHGPIPLLVDGLRQRITSVMCELSSEQGQVEVRLFASDVADRRGDARASFIAERGRNPRRHVRAVGSYAWIELGQATPGAPWAVENLGYRSWPAGQHQVHT